MNSGTSPNDRNAQSSAAAVIVVTLAVLTALLGLTASPARAQAQSVGLTYNCPNDSYRFTAHDPYASGDDLTPFAFTFAKGGSPVGGSTSSDLANPDPNVIDNNTDALGLEGPELAPGDTIDVYYLEYRLTEPVPVPDAQIVSRGRKIATFTYCGISSAAKKAVLTKQDAKAFSYRNWNGTIGYDCAVNALYSKKSHSAVVPSQDLMQEVFVHKGSAGIFSGFASFSTSSIWVGKLVPRLTKGDRVDVYGVPYEWVYPSSGVAGPYPNAAMAQRAVTDDAAKLLYSFDYGKCASPSVRGGAKTMAASAGVTKITKAARVKVKVKVNSAGSGLKGALVKLKGVETKKTSSAGVAKFTFAKNGMKKVKITVTKKGYAKETFRLRLKK